VKTHVVFGKRAAFENYKRAHQEVKCVHTRGKESVMGRDNADTKLVLLGDSSPTYDELYYLSVEYMRGRP
jgi:hypothetical protein